MPIVKPAPTPTPAGPRPVDSENSVIMGYANAAGSTGTAGAYVYMGTQRAKPSASDARYGRAPRLVSRWMTEDQAMNHFYGLSASGRKQLLHKFIVAGIVPLGGGELEAEEAWLKLVRASMLRGAAGHKVGPMDLLAGYVSAAGGMEKGAWQQMGAFEVNVVTGAKRYAGPGVYLGNGRAQQTDVRTDLTDPDTAKAIATRLFQDMMGRDPGAGELGAFATALHTAEANAPVTQTTTTQYNMETGQPISTSTESSGGMTAEGRALIGENQIKGSKEYGVTQAVTHLQNAFENLIFGAPE